MTTSSRSLTRRGGPSGGLRSTEVNALHECPRWSASCARTRPAHLANCHKLLHDRAERLRQAQPGSGWGPACILPTPEGHRTSNPACVLERVPVRASSQDARDERDEGLGPNGPAWLQRGSRVTPAGAHHGSLMARSGGQCRANSAVMQRSRNRSASEPARVFIERSGCCERAPRPGPLMLVASKSARGSMPGR